MKTKLQLHFFVLVLGLFFFMSCTDQANRWYPENLEYVEIPLDEYMSFRMDYPVTFCVDGDTLRGILDTKAENSLMMIPDTVELPANMITPVTLFNGKKVGASQKKFKSLTWGQVRLRDQYIWAVRSSDAAITEPVLGRELLRGSVFQIDHYHNVIKLSTDTTKITPRGIEVPSQFDADDRVYVTLKNDGKEFDFVLDTGTNSEISISGLDDIKYFKEPLIVKTVENEEGVEQQYTLADFSIGDLVFKNCRVTVGQSEEKRIGTTFLRRFKTVTIDYINKRVYFELPDDMHINDEISVKFSGDTITSVPVEWLGNLFDRFNTYGFLLQDRGDIYTVSSLSFYEKERDEQVLALGDTIIGVNETLFSDSYWDQMGGGKKYRYTSDQVERAVSVKSAMYMSNEALFHHLKNGKVHSTLFKRREYLKDMPLYAYSYSKVKFPLMCMELHFYIDEESSLGIHVPWSNLIHREIGFTSGQGDSAVYYSNVDHTEE